MNSKYLGLVLVFAMAFTALQANAQERGRDGLINENLFRPVEVNVRERVQEGREELEARRAEIRREMEAKRSEVQERGTSTASERRVEAQERRGEALEQRTARQQAAAERLVQNVARVMQATVERLEGIADRVDSRIEKLEAAGGDTLMSKAYLAEARKALSEAEEFVSTFSTIDLSGEKAQDNFMRVRTAAAEARELIRSAHQNLSLSVRALAGVQGAISSEGVSEGQPDQGEESDGESEDSE